MERVFLELNKFFLAASLLLLASSTLADVSITSFSIAGGAAYTLLEKPAVTLDANELPDQMKFSCNGTDYTSDLAFQSPFSDFNIASGQNGCTVDDGTKTVYAIVRKGDFNSTAVSDTITLDRTTTTITISLPLPGTRVDDYNVNFTVTDAFSGVDQSSIRVDVNGSTSSGSYGCTTVTQGFSCSYLETKFDTNNMDYNVTVFAKDTLGQQRQGSVIFTYVNLAPLQVTGLTAAPGNGRVTLSWTPSTADDLKEYLVYKSTSSNFDSSEQFTVLAGTTSRIVESISNGTIYYFKVSARDNSNLEGIHSASVSTTPNENATGIPAPTINSSTHSNDTWSTNNDPQFSWDSNSQRTYKCLFDQNSGTIPTAPDCSTPRNPDGTQEGVWYLHLRACDSSGSCGPASHFKAKIDRSGPSAPQDFSVESSGGSAISLSWSASTDNPSGENSGVKEYWVYRYHDDSFDAIDSRKIATTSSPSYTDDDDSLIEGSRYYYKVKAVDNIGNLGALSAERSDIFEAEQACTNTFTFSFSQFVGGEETQIKVTSSGSMSSALVKLNVPGVGNIAAQSSEKTGNSATAVFVLAESMHGRTAEASLTSTGNEGNQCFARKSATIDRKKPTIEFEELLDNDEILDDRTIKFNAADEDSGVKEVTVFFKGDGGSFELLGNAQRVSGDSFEFSDSLSEIPFGETQIRGLVTDNAGNVSEAIVTVQAKTSAELFAQKIYSFSIVSQSALSSLGLNDEASLRARALLLLAKPKKEYRIEAEGDGYAVKVFVSFDNRTGKTGLKVVEVIPKEFAQSASLIESDIGFTVLKDDPIIEFLLDGIGSGEKVSFSYRLKGTLTQEQAESLKSKLSTQTFNVPPIFFEKSENTTSAFVSGSGGIDIFMLVIIGIILLVIVIIVFAALGGAAILHLHKTTNQSDLERRYLHSDGNLMQKASKGLRGWLEKKETEERVPKKKFQIK